ncbi:DNA ligase D [Heyndrickxia sp. NPDC080065]|uniref:DNA ligase D n=1 Tax=Heyndrickxia sp. NPDC080065 TaxID=3390568 RepID=UPI003D042A4E
MKPMLPTLKSHAPTTGNWLYEIKYDGFRAILEWDQNKIHLWSRNEKDLLPQFPEIESYLLSIQKQASSFLPLKLDGELVLLENDGKANFGQLQIRGRMKSMDRIQRHVSIRPCRYLVFDILTLNGTSLTQHPFNRRKQQLKDMFDSLELPLHPSIGCSKLVQFVPYEKKFDKIWKQVAQNDGEGVVAKINESKWEEGKRTETWIKIKNWKRASCFITGYDTSNGYYHVAVYKEDILFPLGVFIFSMDPEQKKALNQVIKANAIAKENGVLQIHPSICVDINYLEWYEQQLREPHFHEFRFDLTPEACTYELFLLNEANVPKEINITHPDKPLWRKTPISKLDYIRYMRDASPFILPFLQNRSLTVIRYPHGVFGEPFYQKNCPDYAPDYITTHQEDGINYIVCNDLQTLMWLANQLAIEYHIPFHTNDNPYVSEIVFDLDPPTRKEFHLAVTASLMMKKIFDQLNLTTFVKTSGNKGLQVYIPLPDKRYNWKDTRLFTEFIANYLVTERPELFTIERLKKHRKGRLYVDFVQHAEGKTIIAPYSMRGHDDALVATPLFWDEVNEELNPEHFTLDTVLERINKLGCPFASYFESKLNQPFEPVLNFLKNTTK